MADPVIAEIVAKPAVDLPGAGLVTNTNGLLADPGVIGIKTGSLDTYNLLSAKDVVVGETTVRIYGSVLGQPDDETRLAASRDALFGGPGGPPARARPSPRAPSSGQVTHGVGRRGRRS